MGRGMMFAVTVAAVSALVFMRTWPRGRAGSTGLPAPVAGSFAPAVSGRNRCRKEAALMLLPTIWKTEKMSLDKVSQRVSRQPKGSMRARIDIIDGKIRALQNLPYRPVVTRKASPERVSRVERWLTTRQPLGGHENFLQLPGSIIDELKLKLESRED